MLAGALGAATLVVLASCAGDYRKATTATDGSADQLAHRSMGGAEVEALDTAAGQTLADGDFDEVWIIARQADPTRDGASQGAALDTKQAAAGSLLALVRRERGGVVRIEAVALPPGKTDVGATISDGRAAVKLTQQFANPYDRPIEAAYTFALPDEAVVHDFVMVIGKRKIRAIVREPAEARRIYAAARRAGHLASLLRPIAGGLFRQRVANIQAGGRVDIELRYAYPLPVVGDAYRFTFTPAPPPDPRSAGVERTASQTSAAKLNIEVHFDRATAVGRLVSRHHPIVVHVPASQSSADDASLWGFEAGKVVRPAAGARITLSQTHATLDEPFVLDWTPIGGVAAYTANPRYFRIECQAIANPRATRPTLVERLTGTRPAFIAVDTTSTVGP